MSENKEDKTAFDIIANTTTALMKQPALHWHICQQHAKAIDHVATTSLKKKTTRADLIETLREKLIKDGQRPTDATMEDALHRNIAYLEACQNHIAAESQEAYWRAARETSAQNSAAINTLHPAP